MLEIYEDIKGYEGIYQISNKGRIFNIKTNKYRKPHIINGGYLQIGLSKKGKVK